LVSYLDDQYGIEIRKQSLDERFNERTVHFVKCVLSRLIREQFSSVLYCEEFLSSFNHVRIKDSTKFNVPSNLKAHYQGSGGSGSTSEAGICIQYEFDLKTGQFLELTLTEAIRNDQQDAKETAEEVFKDDLVIRDLGYFSIPVLENIHKKEAFFLSRLPSHVLVYDEKGVEIDFQDLYVFMTKDSILSYQKTLKTLKYRFSEILSILRCEQEKAMEILKNIYLILSKNHWREKRKKRENYVENIDLFICISQK